MLHSWNTLSNVQQRIDLLLAPEPLKRIHMHYRFKLLMTEFAPYNETAPVDVSDSIGLALWWNHAASCLADLFVAWASASIQDTDQVQVFTNGVDDTSHTTAFSRSQRLYRPH